MGNLLEIYLQSLPTMKDVILNIIPAYDIYCELIGQELEVGSGKLIESPLRADDKPTFGLFVHHEQDVLMFKDFAYETGDVFKFIKLYALYHDSRRINSLYGIALYLQDKLNIPILKNGRVNESARIERPRQFNVQAARNIKFKSRQYTKRDIKYWQQYYITERTLKLYDVRSVYKLMDEEGRILKVFSSSDICFAYVIYNKVKLYQPLEESTFKWRNTCPAHYIQGWKQRRSKKKLIITKSLKDIMVFFELIGNNYDIVAPHSENYNFPEKIVNYINKHYDEVIVIYDFDRAGVNGANKLKRLYNWIPKFIDTKRIMVNNKLKVIDKDISDYIANHGEDKALELCQKKLNL